MLRRLTAAAVLALVLSPGTASAASLARGDRIEVRRAVTPLALDPSLADPRWSDGALTGPLFDLGTKSLATTASFWYDDRALYVGVRAEQKTTVVATQAADDVGDGTDDFVGVLLDVSGNGARTYMFAVTPRGTRYAFAGETARFKPDWSAAALAKLKVPAPKRDYKTMLSALVDVRSGIKPRALPNLRPRASRNEGEHLDPATASALCLALGRRADALAWIELALRDKHERATRGIYALDPRLVSLRDDDRFRALTG